MKLTTRVARGVTAAWLLILLFVGSSTLLAAPPSALLVTNRHLDLRLRFNPESTGSNRLDVVLGGAATGSVDSSQAYLVADVASRTRIPNSSDYQFLGAPGDPVWILPQTQNPNLPYLGVSAEDLPTEWASSVATLELVSAEGPGRFYFWSVSGAGQPPSLQLASTAPTGAASGNGITLWVGSHAHGNWGFTRPGLYRLTLRATAAVPGEPEGIVGQDVTWGVQILPLSPWERWVCQHWPPNTREPETRPDADPDGDGLPNIVEYILGGDPRTASADPRPRVVVEQTPDTTIATVVFHRRKEESDRISVWVRDRAVGGVWEELRTLNILSHTTDFEEVAYSDPQPASSNGQRFYQLRVLQAP